MAPEGNPNLKKTNDTLGHRAGGEYICKASRLVCEIFKHIQVSGRIRDALQKGRLTPPTGVDPVTVQIHRRMSGGTPKPYCL